MIGRLVSAFGVISAAQAALVGGQAGGMQLFAQPSSLSNILSFALSVVPNVQFVGKQLDVNLHFASKGFEINTDWIKIDKYSVGTASVDFDDATGMMRITIPSLTMSGEMQGNMTDPQVALKATATAFSITNANVLIECMTYTDDQVHWRLDENTNVTISDIDFTFKEAFWNYLFKHQKADFMALIDFGLNLGEAALNGAVQALNYMVENEDSLPDEFLGDVAGLMLNFTMTRFPEINQAGNLITVNFDGRAKSQVYGEAMTPLNTVWAEEQSLAKQREQLFIHETAISSWMYDWSKTFTGDIAASLLNAVPELKAQYGDAAVCDLKANVAKEQTGDLVKVKADTGLIVGDATNGGMKTVLTLSCASDATSAKTEALVLDSGLSMAFNASFDNFVVFAEVKDVSAQATTVQSSAAEITSVTDWDAVVLKPIQAFADAFNAKHATPIDFKEKYSVVGFVAGILKNAIATPTQVDGFVYAGFKWITDF